MDPVWAPIITLIGLLAGVLLKHFFPQGPKKSRRRPRKKARARRPRKRPPGHAQPRRRRR